MIAGNIALLLFTGLVLLYWYRQRERSIAGEVLESIADTGSDQKSGKAGDVSLILAEVGNKKKSEELSLTLPLGMPLAVVLTARFIYGAAFEAVLMLGLLSLSVGYLLEKARARRAVQLRRKEMEFFLPIVMERLVMAVQSGLDIIPALKAIISLDSSSEDSETRLDPVTSLLSCVVQLTEAGLGFERSLREVAEKVDCLSVRHACIHLAIAQKEGGELILPLRELSDATQLSYQESIEEEIAAMPIRATVPLLCTFAGLIIFFITSPLIQILNMTVRVAPQ